MIVIHLPRCLRIVTAQPSPASSPAPVIEFPVAAHACTVCGVPRVRHRDAAGTWVGCEAVTPEAARVRLRRALGQALGRTVQPFGIGAEGGAA